ncbi:MAG: hypothetical protein AB7P21_12340 [Lautropia sp.]
MPSPIPRFAAALLIACCGVVHGGRPLNVEDAGVNDPGEGHFEAWLDAVEGAGTTLNLAPAWSPRRGVELSAGLARSPDRNDTASAVQAKIQPGATTAGVCAVAAIAGIGWTHAGGGTSPYATGVSSCTTPLGALHLNLGARREPGDGWLPTWGIAIERTAGAHAVHVEAFGERRAKPTLRAGVRRDLDRRWQLDGTIGHADGAILMSVGFERSFHLRRASARSPCSPTSIHSPSSCGPPSCTA